jgi:predicted enzyme related to lactoylglutathione lyase
MPGRSPQYFLGCCRALRGHKSALPGREDVRADEQEVLVDFKIELIPLAVQDVDRSVEFYGKALGWNVDHDQTVTSELRFVQVTPPGSACSICFGIGLDMMPEGSSQFIQAVVTDADEAHSYLRERGVECSDVDEQPWGRFVRFDDPDGNRWALQQIIRPS